MIREGYYFAIEDSRGVPLARISFLGLNLAQLRKCPVVMIRSTHFGVPPSVAVSAAKSVLPVFLIAARNTSCDHTTQGGATQKSARDYARAPLQLNYILICFLTGRGFR